MKVLVTGASGFLGSHVVEQLLAQKHAVRALVRRSSDRRFLEAKGVELAYGAVEDAESVRQAMDGIDGVVHAAGLVKARTPEEFAVVNVGGTANLLAAARGAKGLRRFVMVSSLAAVGPSSDGRPVPDDATPRPVTHYGRSKLEAERLVRAAAKELPVTIIRPPMIYGPRDRESLAFFKSVATGVLPYLGDGQNTLSVIYGPDCARACVQSLTAEVPSGSTYFVEDGKVYVWKEMLSEIERAMNKRAFLRVALPMPVIRAAALGNEVVARLTRRAVMLNRDKLNELSAPHWVCDAQRARKDLGWSPQVDWAAGVRETAQWYRAEGWL